MNRTAILLASIAATLAAPANAAPDRISIMLGSQHLGSAYHFEQVNPGVFLTWDRVTIGAYRNSFGKGSLAATYAVPVYKRDKLDVALFGGAAFYPGNGENFSAHIGDVVPVGGLQIRYGNVFTQIMPGTDMAVVSFGMTFDLK